MTEKKIRIPLHIAVIMDGNRRWAKKHNLPVTEGHRQGIKSVKRTVEIARKYGIKYLTLYTFSTENWKRSKFEIDTLMRLLKSTIENYREELKQNDISLKVSGDISIFPKSLLNAIDNAVEYLKNCKSMVLNLALNYGGRQEIIQAVNRCIKDGLKTITAEDIEKRLYTFPLPEPDLIIRTSGEMRISNFLLWQSAYSEFYVTDVLWPDFGEKDFYKAILDYSKRERRIGR